MESESRSPDAAANKTTATAARCSDRWREWRKGGENLSIPCMRKPILLLSPLTGEGRGGDPSSKGLLSLQGPFLSLSSPLFICLSSSFSPFWHGRLKEREKGKRISCFGLFLPLPLFFGRPISCLRRSSRRGKMFSLALSDGEFLACHEWRRWSGRRCSDVGTKNDRSRQGTHSHTLEDVAQNQGSAVVQGS